MFKIQTNKKLFSTLLALSCLSVYASDADYDQERYERLKKHIQERVSRSTSIVLGPLKSGKSTLINLLMHTSEYATLETEGDVLINADDDTQAIYHQEIFGKKQTINPKNFVESTLSNKLASVPVILHFMPIFGPVAVLDFMDILAENHFEKEKVALAEDGDGRTLFPAVYHSRSKVINPSFHSTFIDAPGIGDKGRLAFLQNVIEEIPTTQGWLNGFLIVVSGEMLAEKNFGPDHFTYYKEIKKIIEQIDPSFDRVFLVITKAGNEQFLSMIGKKDARLSVSEKFKTATSGMHIPSERIFFFENQYNCLSESSIDKIYNCNIEGSVDPKVERAFTHRVKNYQLNLVESFNLLSALAKKTPVSRKSLLSKISASVSNELRSGQIGKNVNVGPKSYSALGSLTLPEGRWQITVGSIYSGHHGNAYYMHNINTKPDSNDGTTMGVDYTIGSLAREQGIGSAPTMTKIVELTESTTFYLNAETQLYEAGIGGILGSISAVRLSPSDY